MGKSPIQLQYVVPSIFFLIPVAVTLLPIPQAIFNSETAQPIWNVLPYAAGIAFTFFTLRMNRVSEAHMGVLLLGSFIILSSVSDPVVTTILAVTVPAGLSIVLLLSPPHPLSIQSAVAVGITGLAIAYPIGVAKVPWLGFPKGVLRELFSFSELWVTPDISLVLFLILIIVAALKREQTNAFFHNSILISIAALFLAIEADPGMRIGNQPWVRSVSWSSLYGTLLYGTYRLYWQRVYVDDLTGILNRRALDERLRGLRKNYCIAMLDIDHFKVFNDTYGHAEGDNVLRWVATLLKNSVGEKAYRYGGEEFTIIYPGLTKAQAVQQTDAIRKTLSHSSFYLRTPGIPREGDKKDRGKGLQDQKEVSVTFSGGVSESTGKKDKPDLVIQRADEALYTAKKGGRNNIAQK